FADADLDKAATAVAGSVTFNAGQACVAGTRLIVERSVADRLTAAILERMKAVRPGPTWNEATQYSPVISERQRARVDSIVRAAIDAGGECLTGGGVMNSPGYFYQPTLISDVDQTNPAIVEEIFGPVLTIQTFETEEEALALSSHPTYGLASGLFTADLSRTIRFARKLEAGTVWVNRYSRSRDHILPTGGYKRSGIGKDLGREAYLANRRTKSVLISL
ncbi:aldehyde dehydrogenase family protein, partial [Mesorhizobium sp. M7A.T.Ca.TU.009.01.3.2]